MSDFYIPRDENWSETKVALDTYAAANEVEYPTYKSWEWDHTPASHQGVHVRHGEREITWYLEPKNRHGSCGATVLDYETFLATGPSHRTPRRVLEELYAMVVQLDRQS